ARGQARARAPPRGGSAKAASSLGCRASVGHLPLRMQAAPVPVLARGPPCAAGGRQCMMSRGPMDVVITKAGLRPLLFGSTAAVAAAGVLVEVLRPIYGLKTRSGVVPLFSLSQEENVPTFYSAILLLACALLLSFVSLGV